MTKHNFFVIESARKGKKKVKGLKRKIPVHYARFQILRREFKYLSRIGEFLTILSSLGNMIKHCLEYLKVFFSRFQPKIYNKVIKFYAYRDPILKQCS